MTVKRHQSPETGSSPVQLSCEECCQNIPYSRESEDYVAYFCGLTCYQKWETKTHSVGEAKCEEKVFVDDGKDKSINGD
jgi:hypothetical protein